MPTIWIFSFIIAFSTVEAVLRDELPSRNNKITLEDLSESFNSSVVERIIPTSKTRSEDHLPIRDAVEKVPPINPYLQQLKSQYFQKQDVISGVDNTYRVVCFMSSWSWYRKIETKFTPDYVDPLLCTHIVYASASLDPNNYTIMSADPVTDFDNGFYKKITSQDVTSKSKVLLSIGGWTDSAGDKYSKLVSNGSNRRRFVNSVVAYLRRYNFQGLHFDWYYPVCWQARCSEMQTSDRINFVKLIQELRTEFDKQTPRFELAIGVSGYKEIIDVGYDILNLNANVDFMSVMSYDYHGAWENRTGHLSPLYYTPKDTFPEYNVDSTLASLVLLGAEPSKVVMGIPFYGQSFTLANANYHSFGDDAVDAGEPGEYTQQPGLLSYYEICKRIKKQNWRIDRNRNYSTEAYAYKGNQWVGYDDKDSLRVKMQYIRKSGYGGVMTWTLDMDDYSNECCTGVYPLLKTINVELGRIPRSSISDLPDCTKPVIITTVMMTNITTMPTVSVEETTFTTTTEESDFTSNNYWTSTVSSTTLSSTTTKPWWPPTLTTYSTISHRPRPTSTPTKAPSMMTSKRRTTTMRSTYPTFSTSGKPSSIISEDVTPSNGGQCESGRYYSDSTDCSSYFLCVYGKKRKRQCAPGLHWNMESENCDWPFRANCIEHLVSSSHSTIKSTTAKFTTTTTIGTTEMTTQGSTTIQSNRPAVACIDGEHYAVPGECASFYVCDGGRLSKRRCPSGLTWNRRTRLCDWMYNAPCNENYTPDPSLSLRKEWVDKVTELPYPPKKVSFKNDNKCNSGQFTRHIKDCNKYYQCLWGAYKETRCPPGLFWNKQMLICDWPNNVDCEPSNEENESDIETTSKPSTSTSTSNMWWTEKPSTVSTPWWTETKSTSTSSSVIWWTEKPSTASTPWWSQSQTHLSSLSPSSSSSSSWTNTPSTTWSWSETPWTPSTTTAATLPTSKPSKPLSGYYKVICYFTNWAWYRPGAGKYFPEDTDPNLCTHVIYGFAVLDYERLVIKIYDSWADIDNRFYERLAALKRRGVKVSVAIGGWNDSAGDKYSRLVNSESARRNFVSSVLRFMKEYGFDGLDLDWEYPKCWQVNCNKGPDSDKEGFAALVTELRQAFDVYGYLLSSAVSPSKVVIDKGYDVKLLSDKLDWIGVMTYDYHGQWDKKTGHLAPIYYIEGDDNDYFNVNYSINYWIEKGAHPRKLVMGMPMYGQGFTLADASKHDLNAPSYGPSHAGEYTRAGGFLAYYEICQRLQREQWTVIEDPQHRRGPYAYKGDQWVGFDDIRTIKQKVNLIKKFGLGGGMIWALDLDDFRNQCGQGYYPLLTTIAEGLADKFSLVDNEIEDHYTIGTNITGVTITTIKPSSIYTSTKKHKKTTPAKITTTTTKPTTPFISVTSEITNSTTPAATDILEVTHPAENPEDFKIVCYFNNRAWNRYGIGKFNFKDLDSSLCTHIVYAYAKIDSTRFAIIPSDIRTDLYHDSYKNITSLNNRGVKILLAVGGLYDSAKNKYSQFILNKQSRQKFISNAIDFVTKHGFQGLEINWTTYPECRRQTNCDMERSNYKNDLTDFIVEMRKMFKRRGLLLSAALSPLPKVIDEDYDVPQLSQNLDWISIMTYDLHGDWDQVAGHIAPMYIHPDDQDTKLNVDSIIRYWAEKGAERKKLLMGIPTYGASFTLANPEQNSLNSKIIGSGEAGESTQIRGILAFYEICERILRDDWNVEYDIEGRMGPYASHDTQWVSFDNRRMIEHKAEYIYYNDLGGVAVDSIDMDDFNGICNCGKYPLLKVINRVLKNQQREIPKCELEMNSRDKPSENEAVESLNKEWWFEDCEKGQVKKHPTDCSKYLKCSFGVYQLEETCGNGLQFNEKRRICDSPENVNCKLPTETYSLDYSQKLMLRLSNKTDSKYKVICYLTNWSSYRYNHQEFTKQVLDSHLCTNMVYGFVTLDPHTWMMKSNDTFVSIDTQFFNKIPLLKEKGIKVSLALGGWYDSASDKYSRLVNSRSARSQFIKHAVKFLKSHDFDGLEIDWEYPKCWQANCNKGRTSDKRGFTILMRELKEEFSNHNLTLSAVVSANREIIDNAYDIPLIASYIDWLSIMTFDYHGFWEGKTDHMAPLFRELNSTSDYLNVESSVLYWIEKGAPNDKLILGLPFYGQSFTLKNSNQNKLGSKVTGPGEAGKQTQVPGFLAYYEICEMNSQEKWKIVKDKNGHYMHSLNQWISYNDISDIRMKVRYAKQNNLGGILAWSLDLDDFLNKCGCGTYPLLTAANEELLQSSYLQRNSYEDCTK